MLVCSFPSSCSITIVPGCEALLTLRRLLCDERTENRPLLSKYVCFLFLRRKLFFKGVPHGGAHSDAGSESNCFVCFRLHPQRMGRGGTQQCIFLFFVASVIFTTLVLFPQKFCTDNMKEQKRPEIGHKLWSANLVGHDLYT